MAPSHNGWVTRFTSISGIRLNNSSLPGCYRHTSIIPLRVNIYPGWLPYGPQPLRLGHFIPPFRHPPQLPNSRLLQAYASRLFQAFFASTKFNIVYPRLFQASASRLFQAFVATTKPNIVSGIHLNYGILDFTGIRLNY